MNLRSLPSPFSKCRPLSGFTLVEILVVATLLTLLALIAIPNYLEARKESAKSSCISNIKEISYATEQWAVEMRKNTSAAVTYEDIHPYLKGSVVCPAGGKNFDDSYAITVVANEPTCLLDPHDHYWLGSTAVADLQIKKPTAATASAATASAAVVNGLVGGPEGNENANANGKSGSQGGGKSKGGTKLK